MPATSLNHVSLSASNLEESVRFYEEVLGLERIPTPNFGFPVQWLRVGALQLHLFVRPVQPALQHHVALTVDDFEAVYRRTQELGIWDRATFGHHIFELTDHNVQLYIRDPGGNLVELDWPDVRTLDRSIVDDIESRVDAQPQDSENLRASLFRDASVGAAATPSGPTV